MGEQINRNYYHRYIITLEKELKERKNICGENHISVAETLNTLGLVHQHMGGDQDKAIRLHREALNIYCSQLKRRDTLMEISITQADIGSCYWRKGQYTKAKNEFEKSLELLENWQISNLPKANFCRYSVQHRLAYVDLAFSDAKKEELIKRMNQQSSKPKQDTTTHISKNNRSCRTACSSCSYQIPELILKQNANKIVSFSKKDRTRLSTPNLNSFRGYSSNDDFFSRQRKIVFSSCNQLIPRCAE